MLIVQLRSIMINQTGIESWILRKARSRDHYRSKTFLYPYDLGWKENFRQVFNWRETFNVIGDGITWPIRDDSDEYALTREQLEQKREKRQRTVRYNVIQSYHGSFITFKHGCCTCICIPCTDNTRIAIEQGDSVLVTRWEKYWLYGERVIINKRSKKEIVKQCPRGWFPRCCVYEAFRIEDLWSGKIDLDSDVVRNQFENLGPEAYDDVEEENGVQTENNQSDDTTSSSNELRRRKISQED